MDFKRVNTSDENLTIKLEGELDAAGSNKIRNALENVAENSKDKKVLLDMSDVTFLDSSGIGAIIFLFKRLRASDRELELIGVQGQPRELIELLRINNAIPVTLEGEAA